MKASVRVLEGSAVVKLGGRLTVENAGRCREALREAASGGRRVEIALGEVPAADLSFLQLLCAAHRSVCASGGTISLRGAVAEEIAGLAERAGVERCASGPPGCLMRALRRAGARGT